MPVSQEIRYEDFYCEFPKDFIDKITVDFCILFPRAEGVEGEGRREGGERRREGCRRRGARAAHGSHAAFVASEGATYPFLTCDQTELKIVVRANPGLVWIQQGVVMEKWAGRDVPSLEELAARIEQGR